MTFQQQEQATGAVAVPSLAGLLMGADEVGLLFGLIGSVVMLFCLSSINTRRAAFGVIILTTIICGYAAPAIGVALGRIYPLFADLFHTLKPLIALALGAVLPYAIPLIPSIVKRKGDSL